MSTENSMSFRVTVIIESWQPEVGTPGKVLQRSSVEVGSMVDAGFIGEVSSGVWDESL